VESPLTFRAIVIWCDELNGGKIFLRDTIDVEATYADPPPTPRHRRWRQVRFLLTPTSNHGERELDEDAGGDDSETAISLAAIIYSLATSRPYSATGQGLMPSCNQRHVFDQNASRCRL